MVIPWDKDIEIQADNGRMSGKNLTISLKQIVCRSMTPLQVSRNLDRDGRVSFKRRSQHVLADMWSVSKETSRRV